MRCHYEVLGVDRSVSDSDIKKAYRKLALKHHPDKNQDNVEECTRLFTAIQQAYEVLIDPQERAWYDKHREDILRGAGSNYKDDSLNLMPFFSSSCFTGYGDDSEGFYSVYGDVFRRIGEEEVQYVDDGEEPLPPFGDSNSDYEMVVHVFYSYWQSFSTRKSFAWEDQHDLRHAPNRRVQRLMEKENKKMRDVGKKKTNETVRTLVAFVRKRDKRVQAYKKLMEEREVQRQQRVAEKRAKDRQKRLRLQEEYERSDPHQAQASAMFEEELQSLQARLDDEFGKDSDKEGGGVDSEDDQLLDDLFCPACNKLFKTDKAFANHQRSKKHRENAAILRKLLEEEESSQVHSSSAGGAPGNQQVSGIDQSDGSNLQVSDSDQSDGSIEDELQDLDIHDSMLHDECVQDTGVQSTNVATDTPLYPDEVKPDTNTSPVSLHTTDEDLPVDNTVLVGAASGSGSEDDIPMALLRNKQRGKGGEHLLEEIDPLLQAQKPQTATSLNEEFREGSSRDGPSKGRRREKGKKTASARETKVRADPPNFCNVCQNNFPSRNKLFQHIKETGHAHHTGSDTNSLTQKGRDKKSGRRKK